MVMSGAVSGGPSGVMVTGGRVSSRVDLLVAELTDFEAGSAYQIQGSLNAYCLAFFDRH